MSKVKHTLKVLKNLNWHWAYTFYRKRVVMYWFYYLSKLRGQKYWEVDIDGTKIKLGFDTPYHHLFARGLFYGRHERVPLSMFKKSAAEVPAGKAIFDFGGYDGIYGLLAAIVNPHAKVLIIEPDPVNVKQIESNITLSGLSNVRVIQAAIADKSGSLRFALHSGATAGKIQENGGFEVRSLTLADCAREIGSTPQLMKFDAVGAEYGALLAARDILGYPSPLNILLEFYPRSVEEQKYFWDNFVALGYQQVFLYPRSDGGSKYYWVFKN